MLLIAMQCNAIAGSLSLSGVLEYYGYGDDANTNTKFAFIWVVDVYSVTHISLGGIY